MVLAVRSDFIGSARNRYEELMLPRARNEGAVSGTSKFYVLRAAG